MTRRISSLFLFLCMTFLLELPAFAGETASTGTDPGGSVTPNSLSSSYIAFDPSVGGDTCFGPGASQTFCFRAESFTNDWEYVYNRWMLFPSDWNISNVYVTGTPSCTGGGSWGVFSYAALSAYEVNISHPTYQVATDNCVSYYCFDVTAGTGSPNALESWYWDGDSFGGGPHNPCSNDNYTPAGQAACDEAVNPQASIPPCGGELELSPETLTVSGCSREVEKHAFTIENATGTPVTVDLMYNIISGEGTCGGPSSFGPVDVSGSAQFTIYLYPDCAPGGTVVCEVTAQAGSFSDTATISTQCVSGSGWTPVSTEPESGRLDNVVAAYNNLIWSLAGYGSSANVHTYNPKTDMWNTIDSSAPPFGINYARSGCTYANKVYVYGDAITVGFAGLWSYDMDSNTWAQETPGGTAPAEAGVWAPAWVHDPETNICYMTGGATTPGGGNLATVYVYDPVSNEWLAPLSNFTTPRDFHAAFIVTNPSTSSKMLCVAGGLDAASTVFSSTQCYDFGAGSWNAESADIGTLPFGWWGMGYVQKRHTGNEQQLWLTGGSDAGFSVIGQTYYFSFNTGVWSDGGALPSGAVYRNSAVVLNNDIYKLGGASGGFTSVGWTDHHLQCNGCESLSFTDIPSGFWAEDSIYAIACEGITSGYADGTYRPSQNVQRSQMAAFIIRAEYGEDFSYNPTPHFTDVLSGHWAFKYVQKMYDEGITIGYVDGTYRPAENVTRGQMAAFIIKALFGDTFTYTLTPYFSDVPDSHGFFKYIQKMYDEGITTGYADGTYRPSQNVSRAQMATFIAKAFLGML